MMSGPELPYKISSSEEALACLMKLIKRLDDECLRLDKPTSRKIFASSDLSPDPSLGLDSGGVLAPGFLGPSNHQRDKTMLQNSKLQMQPQAVPVSHFSILTEPTYRKTVASSDMDPDPSSGLDYGVVIAQASVDLLTISVIKQCFKIPRFKCNLRQCLCLFSLF